jgi:hypothetical protein
MPPSPLRAGLAGLVDYAGLFPPASLDLPSVVGRFVAHASSDERWMLGRLVVPVPLLDALATLVGALPAQERPRWTVSVIVPADARFETTVATVRQFNETHEARGVAIASVEFAADTPGEVSRFAAAVPSSLERYVEVPVGDGLPGLLDAVALAGCGSKVRTGGITADRIPSSAAVARFLRESVARDLPFKATAGLHHPLRNRYRLTYEPDSAWGRMHGFLNLVLAASLVRKDPGADLDGVCGMLDESDPASFAVGRDVVTWKGLALTTEDLVQGRARALRSIGSCSFEEPVADLRGLGWMPLE